MEIRIDGNAIVDRKMFHRIMKAELELPDYYGENLDALYDLLVLWDDELFILMTNIDIMKENIGDYTDNIIGLFEDLEEENFNINFTILN